MGDNQRRISGAIAQADGFYGMAEPEKGYGRLAYRATETIFDLLEEWPQGLLFSEEWPRLIREARQEFLEA